MNGDVPAAWGRFSGSGSTMDLFVLPSQMENRLPGKILVIGYGNTLRGDDGIGWYVAESLQDAWRDHRVEVRALPLLPPELTLDLADADLVLFIDADCRLQPLTWALEPVIAKPESAPFTSHVCPSGLLFLTQWLHGRCPQAHLLRIGAGYFEFDERLSVAMSGLLPRLISVVKSLVAGWLPLSSDVYL